MAELFGLDAPADRVEASVPVAAEADKARHIEADRAHVVEALAVGLEQRLAVGGHSVIDRMPVSQPSFPATSKTVRPLPTWAVAHFAALVVSKQFFAAMRWSWKAKERRGQAGLAQRIRCFFQASDIGVP